MARKTQPPPKNFEEALAELEQILTGIESGKIGLEESLVKYERGNFLIQHCRGNSQCRRATECGVAEQEPGWRINGDADGGGAFCKRY